MVRRDVGDEVERLACGHLERVQMLCEGIIAGDIENDVLLVRVEDIIRDLLSLDRSKLIIDRVDSGLMSVLNVSKTLNLLSQGGKVLAEGLTSVLRIGEGHGGEHGEHADFCCD